ncbi:MULTISPECIES: NAD(P)-binding domain-containing protein [unclassified Streptomyces]|uniref:NADPH-dependent F420 reductase n=1 Tax=unclassified Streptomyces TaxID=2593676 RepID=UPI002E813453|nr:NAD(P)-binding domain-containing protein [Streptomyces sp. NBC_00562]WUC22778.1 NAD(P)-binding domain-containing protein [Streptomyces sp. NBC_00562]
MKITVIGAGAIGGNLVRKLAAAGHDVQVADARGPEAVLADVLESGARAEALDAAVRDRDVIIISIPFDRVPELAELFTSVPDETVVIDTTNYYPHLNGRIEAVDNGQVESVRNAEVLGRPLIKAWNAALAETQRTKGVPAGTPGRIAIPVAADSEEARRVAMQLVDDAGVLADSWRQQPMGPAYCTELTLDEMGPALAAADRDKDSRVRDSMMERFATLGDAPTHEDVVEMNRAAHR